MLTKKTALFLSLFCSSQFYSVSAFAEDEYTIEDLGTAKEDNTGISYGGFVSKDGSVFIGRAANDSNSDIQVFIINSDGTKKGLGSLKANNKGQSFVTALSSDGTVVIGGSMTNVGLQHGFRYRDGDESLTDLGTFRPNNLGQSTAKAVSADGRVVVGSADIDKVDTTFHAYRHNEGDEKLTDLGTFMPDNIGNSASMAVSADGSVVAGNAAYDMWIGPGDITYYTFHAFRHNEGDENLTDLGTLRADNSGQSLVSDISDDGRVIVGSAATDSGNHAFRHHEGDDKMIDLGTLKQGDLGSSHALAVSADGRVVVGHSHTDVGTGSQAFRHNEGDQKMTALGTLKADNTGTSEAVAVSADGRVVVGDADTDSGDKQAFLHKEGDEKMTGLGTLKADNSGTSSATGVSADGRVVIGTAQNDLNQNRAVVWKTEKAVDLENTIDSMIKSTDKAQQVLGVYEGQLFSLADRNCNLSADKDYCLGIYTNYNNVKDSDLYASGLIGAMRIANTGWTVGGAVNFNLSDNLVEGYKSHGFELPGVGVFVRYNENKDGTGFSSELKGSYLKQKMTITREALDGAEHGEGETKLSGYLVDLGFGYGIQSDKWLVTPKLNLRHHEITRDGYAENRNADFLASYEEMGNKNTNLALAVNSQYALSPKVNLEAEFGSYMTLKNDQKDAVVKIDYIGEYGAKKSYEQADFRPFVKLSSSYAVSPNSSVGVNASWHKTTYNQDFTQAGLMYSYSW
jgi:probable HAF family extracellular repeat protein